MATLNDEYNELRDQQNPPIFLINHNDSFYYEKDGKSFHVITISGLTYRGTPSVLILVLGSDNIYGFLVVDNSPIKSIDIINVLVQVSNYTNAAGIQIHHWHLYLVNNRFFSNHTIDNLDNPNNVISIVREETSGKSKIEGLEFLKFYTDDDNNVIVEIYNKMYTFTPSRTPIVDDCYVYDVNSSSEQVEDHIIGVDVVQFEQAQDSTLQYLYE